MTPLRDLVAGLAPRAGAVRVLGPDGDGVAEIVLDAPGTHNALHPAMMVGFADAVEAVAAARVVLLHGANGTFCSGGDLAAVRAHLALPGAGAELASFMQAATERLAGLDAVVLGVLTGVALGGGAELLTACDVVYASPDARIGWIQARLGVSPGFGGGTRLVARVGAARALSILLDAEPCSALEAHRLGLVDEVGEDPLALARSRARRWAGLPTAALVAAVRTVRAARTLPRSDSLAQERRAFDTVWGGPAHLDALSRAARRG